MSILAAVMAQVLHIALMIAAAPAIVGLQGRIEAWLAGRHGPPLLQPWRDLVRSARKQHVWIASASPVTRHAPILRFAAVAAAAALVPSFARGMAFAPVANLLAIAGLLALGRTTIALAALDPGAAIGGIAAARAMRLSLVGGPALLLGIFSLATLGGTFSLDALVGLQREGLMQPAAASTLTAAAFAVVALVWSLERSGATSPIAMLSDAVETLVWLDLIGAMFLPLGLADADGGAGAWLTGLAAWVLKLVLLTAALAGCQRIIGHDRPRVAAELLGFSGLLAFLAAVLALSGGVPA